jgi:membrane-bound metal-dependent hydrolase YbcI (DUF457 family)
MPLALGHLAAGFLVTRGIDKPNTTTPKSLLMLFLLANSPDIDIAISLLLTGSPWPYHRTFTHSILFAIFMAIAVSKLHKLFHSFPKLSYKWCYWAVTSHVIADYLISPWKVDFLWPLPIRPGLFNGILDHVDKYATLAREVEVILICLICYLMIKNCRPAVHYTHKGLLSAFALLDQDKAHFSKGRHRILPRPERVTKPPAGSQVPRSDEVFNLQNT